MRYRVTHRSAAMQAGLTPVLATKGTFTCFIKSLLLASLALLPATQVFAADQYKVSSTISHYGSPVGTPAFVVKAGASAEIAVKGDEAYELSVEVTPTDNEAIAVSAHLKTSIGSVSSTVTTQLGKAITVASGDIELVIIVDQIGS